MGRVGGGGSTGWKLVRLAPGAEDEAAREVVAVWADAGLPDMSSSTVGELHLLGPGAAGEFGTRWALMVLMSCLSIWQKAAAASAPG